jgi:predicted RND superfamily exporter protein
MGIIIFGFGSFSFLTIIVTTIVLVIAFAESLFFIFNWLAYWREGMDPYKAVDETVRHMGAASGLTMPDAGFLRVAVAGLDRASRSSRSRAPSARCCSSPAS